MCPAGVSPILPAMCQVTILPGEAGFPRPARHTAARAAPAGGHPAGFPLRRPGPVRPVHGGDRAAHRKRAARAARRWPQEAVARGLRLACQAVVEGDCTIRIPEEKGIEVAWKDPAAVESSALVYGEKLIRRRRLQLPEPPSLQDQRADWERLADALRAPRRAAKPAALPAGGQAARSWRALPASCARGSGRWTRCSSRTPCCASAQLRSAAGVRLRRRPGHHHGGHVAAQPGDRPPAGPQGAAQPADRLRGGRDFAHPQLPGKAGGGARPRPWKPSRSARGCWRRRPG